MHFLWLVILYSGRSHGRPRANPDKDRKVGAVHHRINQHREANSSVSSRSAHTLTSLLGPFYSFSSSRSSLGGIRRRWSTVLCVFTVYSLCIVCQCLFSSAAAMLPPPLDSPVSRVHTLSSFPEERRADTPPPCCPSGVLSQFTLILWGTGPSALNPSSSDFPRPSNNSCKTFDAQQICIGEVFTQTHPHTRERERDL